jgi:hypothetical protein
MRSTKYNYKTRLKALLLRTSSRREVTPLSQSGANVKSHSGQWRTIRATHSPLTKSRKLQHTQELDDRGKMLSAFRPAQATLAFPGGSRDDASPRADPGVVRRPVVIGLGRGGVALERGGPGPMRDWLGSAPGGRRGGPIGGPGFGFAPGLGTAPGLGKGRICAGGGVPVPPVPGVRLAIMGGRRGGGIAPLAAGGGIRRLSGDRPCAGRAGEEMGAALRSLEA